MSDSEIDTDVLSEVGSRHSSVSVSGNSDADEFVFEGDFLPYQYEPLASSSNEDILLDSEVEDDDEDGIPRDVLEQRYENTITVDSWCQCGNCSISLLVGAREYRCCKEIDEAMWKFTFEGLDAGCVTSHSDYTPLTNRTVLSQVGPLLKAKSERRYSKHGHTENEFLRAVAYRWLARWLFGEMGWENTRPLAACIYHDIRKRFSSSNSKGYESGKDRATE